MEAQPGYDVIVRHGALDELPQRITAAAPAAGYAIITPAGLHDTIGTRVQRDLADAGLRAELLPFDDREANKTRETWAALTDSMLSLGFGRDACVVAVGGGVTGDIAGFVAATYMRGIPFVQVPTTLLAMIDASVGGKTGVDTSAGKNLVGAFHEPAVVIVDPAVLETLPREQVRSGLAEAVKHGAILDAEYFHWIGEHVDDLLSLDAAALEQLVTRSIALKADIVSTDPFEGGQRAILNFGHTIGHALELFADYTMPHGFAVAIGMCMEAELGTHTGVTEQGTTAKIEAVLTRLGLPVRADIDAGALLNAMRVDKKARGAQPRFVLLERIGTCATDARGGWTHAVDPAALLTALEGAAPPQRLRLS